MGGIASTGRIRSWQSCRLASGTATDSGSGEAQNQDKIENTDVLGVPRNVLPWFVPVDTIVPFHLGRPGGVPE